MSEPSYEEGQNCPQPGCPGRLRFAAVENCSCHISPPCDAHVNNLLECPDCSWREGDEIEKETLAPDALVATIAVQLTPGATSVEGMQAISKQPAQPVDSGFDIADTPDQAAAKGQKIGIVGGKRGPEITSVQQARETLEGKPKTFMGIEIRKGTATCDTLLACLSACWDGNLPSKQERDVCFKRGWIDVYCGYNVITALGLHALESTGNMPDMTKSTSVLAHENLRLRADLLHMASMPHYDQDDAHRLRHQAQKALEKSFDNGVSLEVAKNKIANVVRMAAECGEYRQLMQENSSLFGAEAGTNHLDTLRGFFQHVREFGKELESTLPAAGIPLTEGIKQGLASPLPSKPRTPTYQLYREQWGKHRMVHAWQVPLPPPQWTDVVAAPEAAAFTAEMMEIARWTGGAASLGTMSPSVSVAELQKSAKPGEWIVFAEAGDWRIWQDSSFGLNHEKKTGLTMEEIQAQRVAEIDRKSDQADNGVMVFRPTFRQRLCRRLFPSKYVELPERSDLIPAKDCLVVEIESYLGLMDWLRVLLTRKVRVEAKTLTENVVGWTDTTAELWIPGWNWLEGRRLHLDKFVGTENYGEQGKPLPKKGESNGR